MANQPDAGARQVTVLAALYDLVDGCRELNLRQTGKPTVDSDKIRCTAIIDEASIFTNTELGASLAYFLTYARHSGLRIIYAKQGNIAESVHKDVQVNTPIKIQGRTKYRPDMQTFADGAGRTTVQDLEFMSGVRDGVWTFTGTGADRAIGFTTANPKTLPRGRSYVVSPEDIIIKEGGTELFTPGQIAQANAFLTTEALGVEIRNWAEVNTIYTFSGRGLETAGGDLKLALQHALKDPGHAPLVRCAITQAVKYSVNSRPDLQYIAPRRAYIEHLTQHMLNLAQGKKSPGWDEPRRDLSMTVGRVNKNYNVNAEGDDRWKRIEIVIDGRYGNAKDALRQKLSVVPHQDTPSYEMIIGKSLYGINALEHKEEVARAIRESTDRVIKVIREPTLAGVNGFADDVRRLVGGRISAKELDADAQQKALTILRKHILDTQHTPLSPTETLRLSELVAGLTPDVVKASEGYTTVVRALDARIQERAEAVGRIGGKEMKRLCGQKVPGANVLEQLNYIERVLEQEEVQTQTYAGKIQPNRLFYAFDPLASTLGSGATLDHTVATMHSFYEEDGPFYQAVAKQANVVVRNYSAGGQILAGEFDDWRDEFGLRIIFNPNYQSSAPKQYYLARGFGRTANNVSARIAKARAQVAAAAAATKAAAGVS